MPKLLLAELLVFSFYMPQHGRHTNMIILTFTFCFVFSANTYAIKGKRKTILPNDLFQALADMELEEFIPELKESLEGGCVIFTLIIID